MAINDKKTINPFQKLKNEHSNIKKVIAVTSGKGGVGKSMVTASLATALADKGLKVGIMDADITGPSIPKMFGLKGMMESDGEALFPFETNKGIKVVSINLLVKDETEPVLWRGPVIGTVVKQFFGDVYWGDLDVLLIDMPPGTGDVPLTVFQSIEIDGTIIVTSPQELVKVIVSKAYNMATKMNIDVLGVIENFSYMTCPDCGKKIQVFGESHIQETASEMNIDVLGQIPIIPAMAGSADAGDFDNVENKYLDKAIEKIINL